MCFAFASIARAHGGPPEIERVIANDLWGPWLVELSEGFARRSKEGDDWTFVCPAAFGADLPPRAVTTAREVWLGREVFVSGATDLYRMNMLGEVTAENRPDFASSRVLALAALDGGLLALRVQLPREPGGARGSELVLLRDGVQETVFEDAELWNTLLVVMPTVEGPLIWLARLAGEGVELLLLSADGVPRTRHLIDLPASPTSVRLIPAGEHVFLVTLDNSGYSLLYVALREALVPTLELVSGATRPILGPAFWGADIVFTKDDQALRLTSDAGAEPGVAPSDSPYGDPTTTCLTTEFVCAQSRLYANEAVEAAGGFDPDAAIFDLAELGAPLLSIEDSELSQYCSAQWAVFRADLVRAGILEGSIADGGVADGGEVMREDAGTTGGTDAGVAGDAAVDEGAGGASAPMNGTLDAGSTLDPSDGGARTVTACGCETVGARERANSAPMIALLLAVTSSALYARRRRAHAALRS